MNRRWCYFDKDQRCIFPVACPRDSVCRLRRQPIPVPNDQFTESYE
jgi:hypothetical protein